MKFDKNHVLVVLISTFFFGCTDYEKRPESVAVEQSQQEGDGEMASNFEPSTNDVGKIREPVLGSNENEISSGAESRENDQRPEFKPEKADPSEIVTLQSGNEGYVEWQAPTDVTYSKADVVVIGADGRRKNYQFRAGEPIVVNESLADGLYQWESVVTPEISASAMEEMREARLSGNLEEEQSLLEKYRQQGLMPTEAQIKNNRQGGAFVVKDGVATPTTTETIDKGDVE